MSKENETVQSWVTVGHPGYLGKNRDKQYSIWDQMYGAGRWQIAWQITTGEVLDFGQIFQHYVDGYALYFENHFDEAIYLTDHFSFGYDKDLVSKGVAFNPRYLVNKPGTPNQFHHVALNFALEFYLGLDFKGENPIQIREGKPGSDPMAWPAGWQWGPGRIPAVHPELIPPHFDNSWWQSGSVEDLYQSAKILQIKK